MRVFDPIPTETTQWALPVDSGDFETFRTLGGQRQGESWFPLRMELVKEDKGWGTSEESDIPWTGGYGLVLRATAKRMLESFLAEYGEILPLVCDETELWFFNPCCVLDALDEKTSALRRFPSSGRVMHVESFVFRPEIIGHIQVFKIPQLLRSSMFVGTRFVELVRSCELTGLEFKLLWDSEV